MSRGTPRSPARGGGGWSSRGGYQGRHFRSPGHRGVELDYRRRLADFGKSPLVASTFAVLLTTVFNSGLGYGYWVAVAHFFPHVEVGESTALIGCVSVISLLAAQPFGTSVLGRLPRLDPEERRAVVYSGVVATATLAGVAGATIVILLPDLIPSLKLVRSPWLAATFVLGSVACSVGVLLDAASIAVRVGRVMTVRNVGHSFGKLVLLVAIASATSSSGAGAVVLSWCGMAVVVTGWAARELVRINGIGWPSEVRPGWARARAGYGSQFASTLGGAVPTQLLPVLVAARLGPSSAAYFSLTWLVGGVFFIISPAVCQALLAEASYDPLALRQRTFGALGLITALLVPTVLVLVACGERVLSIFGAAYASHGYRLLVVLAISTVPDAITNVAVSVLRVREDLRRSAGINMLIGGVAVAGAWLLLPSSGIDGAGYAWLLAQVAGCGLYLVWLLVPGAGDRVGGRVMKPAHRLEWRSPR